jgi:hypothetical protein
MSEKFDRWKKYRDEKNEANREIGDSVFYTNLSKEAAEREARLIRRYNNLYAWMYQLQNEFTAEDWQAYEADQKAIGQTERQLWLIRDRYGDPKPPQGIADWWKR